MTWTIYAVTRSDIIDTMSEMGYDEKEIADMEAEDETIKAIDAVLRKSTTST